MDPWGLALRATLVPVAGSVLSPKQWRGVSPIVAMSPVKGAKLSWTRNVYVVACPPVKF